MKKNSPKLWDEIWINSSINEQLVNMVKEENSIRWQRIENKVLKIFCSFKNLNVIEIGAGLGTISAIMAKRGAKISIFDYSESALNKAKEFFTKNGLSAEYILQNALTLPDKFKNKYDISMSFGLAEHFIGDERVKIIKTHFDVIKQFGITFVSVPNKNNFPYRIWKYYAIHTNNWDYGEEYPFSRKELINICNKIGIINYEFFGDSFIQSLNLINPFIILKQKFNLNKNSNINKIRKEKGTFLDQYLSYALILSGQKTLLKRSAKL